jgi:hypothetical protein
MTVEDLSTSCQVLSAELQRRESMDAHQLDHAPQEAKSPEAEEAPKFPAARYFQVHFEHLYALIGDLQTQLAQANQRIETLRQMHLHDRREIDPRLPPMIPGRGKRM